MNLLALKMLLGDRLKYLGLVIGIAFASLLITQQASIFYGYAHRIGAWIRDTGPADLWVMDPQAEYTEDQKPLPDTTLQRVRSVDGVAWAAPMWKGYLPVRLQDGTLVQARIVGIDDATLLGGPPRMVDGELADLHRDRAVFVDRQSLADLRTRRATADGPPRDLRVGDRIDVNDFDAVVAGTFERTPEFFWDPLLYTTYSRALAMAPRARKQLTFVLVKVRDGADVGAVASAIAAATGCAARTRGEFEGISESYVLAKTGILVNFGITIALGFVIGVLVAGQLLYNFVVENLRYHAALKAMGATNGVLVRMVLTQALLASTIGFGIGVGGAALSGIGLASGGLAFEMDWRIPLLGFAAILAVAAIAVLVSITRVLRLEPAVVFKG